MRKQTIKVKKKENYKINLRIYCLKINPLQPLDYKNMLIESASKDVVYTNYFSGVKGNYLSPSVARAGMDPDNLPEADKTKMNFNSGGNASKKVWKDIYGSGQGISSIKNSPSVAELVQQMKSEFDEAKESFSEKLKNY